MKKVPEFLEPEKPNKECPHCHKKFYNNEKKQRGKPRIYCSMKCRNAAAYKRITSKITDLRKENERLKKELTGVK